MSREFLQSMSQLTEKYGQPLIPETGEYSHHRFLGEAARAGNDLPLDSVLGRVAYGAEFVGNTPIIVELAMLNESFGMMPEDEVDQLCGSISIDSHGTPQGDETKAGHLPLTGDIYLYTSGLAEVTYFDYVTTRPELQAFAKRIGVGHLALREHDGIYELIIGQNRILDADQTRKFQTFVMGAFVELPSA
jgi:hypothetical protein